MMGKLNDNYHIICFTNTVFNAAMLCTISVLSFFTSPNETRKEREIIKLQTLCHCEMQNI